MIVTIIDVVNRLFGTTKFAVELRPVILVGLGFCRTSALPTPRDSSRVLKSPLAMFVSMYIAIFIIYSFPYRSEYYFIFLIVFSRRPAISVVSIYYCI